MCPWELILQMADSALLMAPPPRINSVHMCTSINDYRNSIAPQIFIKFENAPPSMHEGIFAYNVL